MVFDFLPRNAFVKVAIGHELYTPMLFRPLFCQRVNQIQLINVTAKICKCKITLMPSDGIA